MPPPAASPTVSYNSSAKKQTKLHILLVDDSQTILKMCGMVLRRVGHTVTTAENGVVALKLLSTQLENQNTDGNAPLFDVVLMDLQMPVMDGLEATSRLRKLENDTNEKVEPSPAVVKKFPQKITRNSEVVEFDNLDVCSTKEPVKYHQLIIGTFCYVLFSVLH